MGRVKLIETPEKMWELFSSYVDSVKENPRTVSEFHGKDGEERVKPLERPLTLSGFNGYVWDLQGIKSKGILHYFTNQDDLYGDYIAICSRIKQKIKTDQIEGGMVGQYNSSITQRLNGLVDKTQTEIKAEPRVFNI